MEPPSDSVAAGSVAGPGLGAISNDEHILVEQGSAERVGSNLSTHNTTLAGQFVQQPTGQSARAAAAASHGTSSSSPPLLGFYALST